MGKDEKLDVIMTESTSVARIYEDEFDDERSALDCAAYWHATLKGNPDYEEDRIILHVDGNHVMLLQYRDSETDITFDAYPKAMVLTSVDPSPMPLNLETVRFESKEQAEKFIDDAMSVVGEEVEKGHIRFDMEEDNGWHVVKMTVSDESDVYACVWRIGKPVLMAYNRDDR